MDDDMREVLETFSAESAEHIQKATDCILLLEGNPDEETTNSLFRTFHTIKGNSLMLGFSRIGELAHAVENVMARLCDGSLILSKQVIDLLLAFSDTIGTLIAEQTQGIDEGSSFKGLIAALNAVFNRTESPRIFSSAVKKQKTASKPFLNN